MPSAYTARAAAALPSATASWTGSTSSTARSPRASASWAAISRLPRPHAMRSARYAPGFIFTTSLAPAHRRRRAGVASAISSCASVERDLHQERAATLKRRLSRRRSARYLDPSHIVPVLVGRPCPLQGADRRPARSLRHLRTADQLSDRAAGTERMRLTPSPVHSDEQMAKLINALDELWSACPVANGTFVRLAAE